MAERSFREFVANGGFVIHKYLTLAFMVLACEAFGQVSPSGSESTVVAVESQAGAAQVPLTIRLSGKLMSPGGTAGGVAGITFSIYSEEEGGIPLYTETQNLQLDTSGRYAVVLGKLPNSLPLDKFASGDARWIEVVSDGYLKTPRTQIVSVPYALSASNAEMLGGRPASDFVLVQQASALMSQQPSAPIIGIGPWPIIPPITETRKAWSYESTASQGPSFISDAKSGPPFLIYSQDLVPNLNVGLLNGLPASAFAQLAEANAFQVAQVFHRLVESINDFWLASAKGMPSRNSTLSLT
jgi:hypothetical protein